MPRLIQDFVNRPDVLVLAAAEQGPAAPASGTTTTSAVAANGTRSGCKAGSLGKVHGVVVADRRCDAVFLFGLRVREEVRERRIAGLLMDALCAQAPTVLGPGVTRVLTATTSYNPAAHRLIARLLPGPVCQVEDWPAWPQLDAYEEEAGWGGAAPALRPDAPHMLDWIPGARAALAADARAQELAVRWQRAASLQELRPAVARLLRAALAPASACGGGRSGGCGGAAASLQGVPMSPAVAQSAAAAAAADPMGGLLWLPMPYEVFPLDSPWTEQQLQDGNVWLLHDEGGGIGCSSASSNGAPAREPGACIGVMVACPFPILRNRLCIGVFSGEPSVFHSAVIHAGQRAKHFLTSNMRCYPPPASAVATAAATAQPARAPVRRPERADDPHPAAQQQASTPAAAAGDGGAQHGAVPAMGSPQVVAMLPALYGSTRGGYADWWVYGGPVGWRPAEPAAPTSSEGVGTSARARL